MKRGTATKQITEGVIWKQILAFFFPILLGTFFQQMYNTVDTIIVGRFVSTQALAAVGTTGPLVNIFNGFFTGLGSGATVILAQFYGAGNKRGVRDTLHTGVTLSLLLGLLIMVLGIGLGPVALQWMHTPADWIWPRCMCAFISPERWPPCSIIWRRAFCGLWATPSGR